MRPRSCARRTTFNDLPRVRTIGTYTNEPRNADLGVPIGISNCYSTSEAESSDSDDNAGSYRPISDARNGKGKSLHTPSRPGTLSASNSLPQPVSSSLRTTELLKEEISQLEQGRRARLPRDDIAQARVLKAALKLIENQVRASLSSVHAYLHVHEFPNILPLSSLSHRLAP